MKKQHSVVLCAVAQGNLLTSRCAHVLGAAGLAFMLGAAPFGTVRAQDAPVGVPDKSFPESLSSTKDGTLYVGSFNLGGVVKAAPGGKAEQFIQPGAGGSRSVLGVLADENSGTLYVCSNDITGFGVPGPGDTKGAWLKTFDLASGAPKGSFALKYPKSLCNDIAIGADGTAYVTNSLAPIVYSLKPGGTALRFGQRIRCSRRPRTASASTASRSGRTAISMSRPISQRSCSGSQPGTARPARSPS